jgi:hypothetical protein
MFGWERPRSDEARNLELDASLMRPAGLCSGAGHRIDYGNPAFLASFGAGVVGLPAREVLLDLPAEAFELFDLAFRQGRPLGRWIRLDDQEWRLTAMPRLDPETGAPYGVAFHLRARSDLPVLRRR